MPLENCPNSIEEKCWVMLRHIMPWVFCIGVHPHGQSFRGLFPLHLSVYVFDIRTRLLQVIWSAKSYIMKAESYNELRLLLFVMVMLSGVASQPVIIGTSPDYGDYCSRRMAAMACPSPPTIDNLDLRTFLGSYYEVGTTARYKLRSEGGLVCAHSNFSVDIIPPPQDQTSVVTIDVQNSGMQVMGIESVSALSKIAYSAADVCANAARMCTMMDTSSKLSEAVFRMGSVINNILASSPSDAETLYQASAFINSTVVSVKERLDGLARSITTISRVAAELSQGAGPLESLLRAIRSTVAWGGNEVHDLGTIAIGNLTLTRNLITQVIMHMTDANSVELLSEASTLIEQEIEVITSQVSGHCF